MPTHDIRPLSTADAVTAADLIRTAFADQSVPTDPPSAALRETTKTIAAAIGEGGGAGAQVNGELVGVVLWAEQAGSLYFGRLAVLPAWRGHGVARALIAGVEAEARRRNLRRVHLSARLALLDNRKLFASCGYTECELRTHDGYAAPTSVVMEKLLPEEDQSS